MSPLYQNLIGFALAVTALGACGHTSQEQRNQLVGHPTPEGEFSCELTRTGLNGPFYFIYLERQASSLDPTTLTFWCQNDPPHHFSCPPTRTRIYYTIIGKNFTVFPTPDGMVHSDRLFKVYPNSEMIQETDIRVSCLPEK